MGLDLVEVIMEAEDHFGVVIDDASYDKLRTVGDLHRAILHNVREWDPPAEPATVWNELVVLVARSLSVDESEIEPETRFIEDLHAD